eukprot:2185303-Rhodomonas_salina.1
MPDSGGEWHRAGGECKRVPQTVPGYTVSRRLFCWHVFLVCRPFPDVATLRRSLNLRVGAQRGVCVCSSC